MATSLECTPRTLATPPAAVGLTNLRNQMRAMLTSLYPQGRADERRREMRFPFPYLVRLTPVGDKDLEPCGESVVVVGKHISEHGLGFYHVAPLAYRRVKAAIPASGRPSIEVVMDLTWCRFTREGWYDGGGRFLDVITTSDGAATP